MPIRACAQRSPMLFLKKGNAMKGVSLSILALLLPACAASPKVTHSIIRSSEGLRDDQVATYSLQENVVTFNAVTTGEGDKKKTTVTAETDREDHEGVRLAMTRTRRVGINTDVTIKKFENTDIPSEITVKVEDTRADLVKKAGELIVGVVKSGLIPFSQSQEVVLPERLNLSRLIDREQPAGFMVNTDSKFEVVYSEIPPDAVRTTIENIAKANSYFYYAACRKARVSFRYKGEAYQFIYKVADPHFLQRQRMPADGKIVLHSQCGASVTGKMAGEDAASALTIGTALVAQGQSIKDAIEAAKEKDK